MHAKRFVQNDACKNCLSYKKIMQKSGIINRYFLLFVSGSRYLIWVSYLFTMYLLCYQVRLNFLFNELLQRYLFWSNYLCIYVCNISFSFFIKKSNHRREWLFNFQRLQPHYILSYRWGWSSSVQAITDWRAWIC